MDLCENSQLLCEITLGLFGICVFLLLIYAYIYHKYMKPRKTWILPEKERHLKHYENEGYVDEEGQPIKTRVHPFFVGFAAVKAKAPVKPLKY